MQQGTKPSVTCEGCSRLGIFDRGSEFRVQGVLNLAGALCGLRCFLLLLSKWRVDQHPTCFEGVGCRQPRKHAKDDPD